MPDDYDSSSWKAVMLAPCILMVVIGGFLVVVPQKLACAQAENQFEFHRQDGRVEVRCNIVDSWLALPFVAIGMFFVVLGPMTWVSFIVIDYRQEEKARV